jgi:hypothetical protein
MANQTMRNSALAPGLLGLALIPSTGLAQVGVASKLPARRGPSGETHTASPRAKPPGAPAYTYTLLNFPGTYYTCQWHQPGRDQFKDGDRWRGQGGH